MRLTGLVGGWNARLRACPWVPWEGGPCLEAYIPFTDPSPAPAVPSLYRPGAAQICVQKQDHGLDAGLDVQLVPMCEAALPDDPDHAPQPVFLDVNVKNTHR